MSTSNLPVQAPSWKPRRTIAQVFGVRLKELRTERGYTQMQLSEMTGLDRSFISDIERGMSDLTVSSLYACAEAFEMTLSQLFKGVEITD